MPRNVFAALGVLLVSTTTVWAFDHVTPTLTDHFTFDGVYTSEVSSRVAEVASWGGNVPVGTDDGVIGGAAYFDGGYDYGYSTLLIDDTTVLPGSGGFTIAFWEKAEAKGDLPNYFLFSDAAENDLYQLFLQRYTYPVRDDSGNLNPYEISGFIAGEEQFLYPGTMENGYDCFKPQIEYPLDGQTWLHHVVTYQDNGNAHWYVNGELAGYSRAFSANSWQGLSTTIGNGLATGLSIGGGSGMDWCYKGYMDDVQIYDGGVSKEMASYLYDNPGSTLTTFTPATPTPPANPTGHQWKFDTDYAEASGGPAATATGAGVTIGSGNGAFAGSNALAFDGTDAYVTVPKSAVGDDGFSVAVWVNAANTGMFLSDAENGAHLFVRHYGDWLGTWANYQWMPEMGLDGTHETPVQYNTWYQHVMTISDEGEFNYYVNGKLLNWTMLAEWDGLLGDLMIGNTKFVTDTDGNVLNLPLEGLMDDLQTYNYVLDAEDVTYLFANPGQTVGSAPEIPGDANRDGKVDGSDVTILANHWQEGVGNPDPMSITWDMGDFNRDGQVDGSDVTILANHWQEGVTTAAASVPEPSTLVLLLAAAIGIYAIRRRK